MCKLSIEFATSRTTNLAIVDSKSLQYTPIKDKDLTIWTHKLVLDGTYDETSIVSAIDTFLATTVEAVKDSSGVFLYGLENLRFIVKQYIEPLREGIKENKGKTIRLAITKDNNQEQVVLVLSMIPSDSSTNTEILEAKLNLAYSRH
jgi:hypothetical protein